MITPKQLYSYPPISTSREVFRLERCFPEVSFWGMKSEQNQKIELRYYAQHSYDGRRCWVLFSVWFENQPFMIGQEAGREGDDHRDFFVTNLQLYQASEQYLMSLNQQERKNNFPVISETEIKEELTSFYGDNLEHYYNPNTVQPKYQVGDIVVGLVLENHLDYSGTRIPSRVRIESVDSMNPTETYHGHQIDRKWSTEPDFRNRKIIVEIDKGEIGTSLNDSQILKLLERRK